VSNLTEQEEHDSAKAKRSEAALAGHLDNDNADRRVSKPAIHPEEGKKYEDFQLSYAIDRLNGNGQQAASQ
jgi:hypothetical protein